MANILRGLADEIAFGLAKELRGPKFIPAPPAPGTSDMFVDQLLVDQIVKEVVNRMGNVEISTVPDQQILLQRLQQVESALEKVATRIRSGPEGYQHAPDNHEQGSKYQNVDSLLKYVDGSGAEGGVKLVIMNFND